MGAPRSHTLKPKVGTRIVAMAALLAYNTYPSPSLTNIGYSPKIPRFRTVGSMERVELPTNLGVAGIRRGSPVPRAVVVSAGREVGVYAKKSSEVLTWVATTGFLLALTSGINVKGETKPDPVVFPPIIEKVIPFKKSDEITKLKRLQSTDSQMLTALERRVQQDDQNRPLLNSLKMNLQEERRAIEKERDDREKLKSELRFNQISQISLGIALTAFIVERQSSIRARKAEEEVKKDESLKLREAEANATRLFFLPNTASSKTTKPASTPTSNRTFWESILTKPEEPPVDPEPPVDSRAEDGGGGWGWWRGVKGFTVGIFDKAKGTMKKKKNPDSGEVSTRKKPKKSREDVARRSVWVLQRSGPNLREQATVKPVKRGDEVVLRRSIWGKEIIEGSSRDIRKKTPENEETSTIQVRILWKSAKTFWRWRPLSTVNVKIRGQLFLRLQMLLEDVVNSTGYLAGVEEGLSRIITRNVARRLYANPVDQNVEYAYQVLRGPTKGQIINLPSAKEIEELDGIVPPKRIRGTKNIGRKTLEGEISGSSSLPKNSTEHHEHD